MQLHCHFTLVPDICAKATVPYAIIGALGKATEQAQAAVALKLRVCFEYGVS